MILALFGTNPYPFKRLAGWLDRLACVEGYKIVAQTGSTPALAHCLSFDFEPYESIQARMEQADCIVAQGGYGSCLDALSLGRPLVIVPRQPELGESRDNQSELSRFLAAHSDARIAESYGALRQAIAQLQSEHHPPRTRADDFGVKVGAAIQAFLNEH